jgi:hypothetical protein
MTKKDMKKIEELVKEILDDMLYEVEPLEVQSYGDTTFSVTVLQEMEAYLGHEIDFMAIS